MAGYAHPEALVDTAWVAAHGRDSGVRLVEVDVDTSAYELGHVPGAIAWNWTTQLSDPVRRDVLSKDAFECLMAQSGIPVPAQAGTSLPVFTRLFVDLGDRQSIHDDLSTFTSHLNALRAMLVSADERSLVLIDEAGTGTDPAEGGALAEAVLARLTQVGARTIATTHHGTLKAFAHNTLGVANGSMVGGSTFSAAMSAW